MKNVIEKQRKVETERNGMILSEKKNFTVMIKVHGAITDVYLRGIQRK